MKRSNWGTLIWLLVIPYPIIAQIQQLPVAAFSQAAHLSHPTCRSMAFDQQGFLWVGTDHGLNRFDGYQFSVYKPSVHAADQRPWGRINALARGKDHSLWVGTASGLYRISTAPGKTLAINEEVTNLYPTPVIDLIQDGKGGIWVAGTSKLFRVSFDPVSQQVLVENLRQPHEFLRTGITTLAMEEQTLLVGTEQGLLKIQPDSRLPKPLPVLGSNGELLPIKTLRNSPSGLWIGAGTQLFFKPYALDQIYHEPLEALGQSPISDLFLDKKDYLWITTEGSGLVRFDLKTRQVRSFNNSQLQGNLPDETLHAVLAQQDGLLWIASQRAGLVRLQYEQNRFQRFIVEPYKGQNDRAATAICEDPLGNLWIGNQDGLVRQDATTGSIIHFFHDPANPASLPGDTIQSLTSEANGTLWVGTFRSGLARLAPGSSQFERFVHQPGQPSSLPSNQVNALAIDKQGTVWVGTRTGLVHFSESSSELEDWVNPEAAQGDPPLFVTALEPSQNGGLWFGTFHGFGRINQTQAELFLNQLEGEKVWPTGITYIKEDKIGQVWISSAEGLLRFSPTHHSLTPIHIADVVPDRRIHAIMEGKPGDLWLTSNYGLVQLRNSIVRRVYGSSSGLQSREFIQSSAFQSASGILYAGGPKGYNRFDPHQDYELATPPKVVLTSVRVMGDAVDIDLSKGLKLNNDQRFFTIEYSALDYKSPHNSQYAFKLLPSDEAWHFADKQRYLSYANLKAGSYTLHIKAANSQAIWNDEGLQIPIEIVPPYWQTKAFRVCLILSMLLVVGLVLQYRVRHLRSRQMALQKQVTHSTKSLYEAHARLAEDAHKAGVAEISTGVLHNIGNILNSVTVSTNTLRRVLIQSKLSNFQKAIDMIQQQEERPAIFYKESRRGGLLTEFFLGAEAALSKESQNIHDETMTLMDQIALMGKAVSLEQSYANRFDKKIKVNMPELVDNAVRLQEMTLKKRQIELFKAYHDVPECNVETFKLAHVITNLVRNAADALYEIDPPPEGRRIIVSVEKTKPGFVQVAIADNGIGIAAENLLHMFSFGFTTKAHGNGFGLHSSHAIMQELGGSIEVESEGLGKGACFVLQVPLESREKDTLS